MCTNIIYQALIEVTNDVVCLSILATSVVNNLDSLGLPFVGLGLVLVLFFLNDLGSLLALDDNLGSSLLMEIASLSLGLLGNSSGTSAFSVVLAHDVAVVSDNTARSVPGLVDSRALDGAGVEVGLTIDTADGLVLGVASAVVVNNDLARLFLSDRDK